MQVLRDYSTDKLYIQPKGVDSVTVADASWDFQVESLTAGQILKLAVYLSGLPDHYRIIQDGKNSYALLMEKQAFRLSWFLEEFAFLRKKTLVVWDSPTNMVRLV